ncbi:MAG: hypothetical protein VB124_01170, partial [Burkholderia sp.]
LAHVLARKDRESTHEPESITEASLGLWRVNVTSASRINATTPDIHEAFLKFGCALVCWNIFRRTEQYF